MRDGQYVSYRNTVQPGNPANRRPLYKPLYIALLLALGFILLLTDTSCWLHFRT